MTQNYFDKMIALGQIMEVIQIIFSTVTGQVPKSMQFWTVIPFKKCFKNFYEGTFLSPVVKANVFTRK